MIYTISPCLNSSLTIAQHNSMGFALQIIENLEGIKDTVQDECQMEEVCKSWKAYANAYDVFTDDIDSGV